MRTRLLGALVLGCCLLGGIAGATETSTFEGVGRATISAGDQVRARDRALADAFQRAVEAAVGSVLGPDVLTRHASDLRLKILPRARTYVTRYRVAEEGELEPGNFVVKVSAEIAIDRLAHELADRALPALAAPASASRYVVCIAVDPVVPVPKLDAALRALFGARKVDVTVAAHCDDSDPSRAGARASLLAEVAAGPLAPIRGTALLGREVKLALRLVDSSGRRTAEARGEAAGYAATAEGALDDAAQLAVTDAMPALESALGLVTGTGVAAGLVIARVVGVRRFDQLAMVRSALERLPGVDGAEPRLFLPGAPGIIELGVRTQQPVRALLEGLTRAAATYPFRAREADGVLQVEVLDATDPGLQPGAAQ